METTTALKSAPRHLHAETGRPFLFNLQRDWLLEHGHGENEATRAVELWNRPPEEWCLDAPAESWWPLRFSAAELAAGGPDGKGIHIGKVRIPGPALRNASTGRGGSPLVAFLRQMGLQMREVWNVNAYDVWPIGVDIDVRHSTQRQHDDAHEVLARTRSVTISWSRRSGKTTFACRELIAAARAAPDRSLLLVSSTAQHARDALDILRGEAASVEGFRFITESRMSLANGSTVEVMTNRHIGRVIGRRYDGVALDEEQHITPEMAHAAITCTLRGATDGAPGFVIRTRTRGEIGRRPDLADNAEAAAIAQAHVILGEPVSEESWRVSTSAYEDPRLRTPLQLAAHLAAWMMHPRLDQLRVQADAERHPPVQWRAQGFPVDSW